MSPAVLDVARAEFRRRWRGLIGLGLIAGLNGAVVLSAAVVGRRTATAYPRLERATNADDLRGLLLAEDQEASIALGARFGQRGWAPNSQGPAHLTQ